MEKLTNLKVFLIEHWYPQNRTDSDLAERLEVDKTMVSKWVNGLTEPPLARKIQIAKVLGVDSRLVFPEEKK